MYNIFKAIQDCCPHREIFVATIDYSKIGNLWTVVIDDEIKVLFINPPPFKQELAKSWKENQTKVWNMMKEYGVFSHEKKMIPLDAWNERYVSIANEWDYNHNPRKWIGEELESHIKLPINHFYHTRVYYTPNLVTSFINVGYKIDVECHIFYDVYPRGKYEKKELFQERENNFNKNNLEYKESLMSPISTTNDPETAIQKRKKNRPERLYEDKIEKLQIALDGALDRISELERKVYG